MSNLETLIQTCIEIGSAKTLETLGVSSGEISQRRAGTRWYRVVDILKLKAADAARAELKL